MEQLESAFFTVGINIVAQGAAAVIDGSAQNDFDGAVEANDLLALEAMGGDGGVNAAVEKGFIGVDVADAGDEALIQQRCFDRTASPGKARNQFIRTHCQRLGPEVFVMCLTVAQPPDAAETTGVAEAKLGVAGEIGDQVRVRLNGLGVGFYCQTAGHSEVDAEGVAGVEADENFLAAPCDAGDSAAFEQFGQINAAWLDNVGPKMLDGGDALPDEMGREGADDGFDFG